MPRYALVAQIMPCYRNTSKKASCFPYPLAPSPLASERQLLRMQQMQQRSSLSNPGMEEELLEVPTMRRCAGIDLIGNRIPDETTILTFRRGRSSMAPRLLLPAQPSEQLESERGGATRARAAHRIRPCIRPRLKTRAISASRRWAYSIKASIGVDIGSDPIHFNGDFFFVLLGSKDVAARSFRASGGDK